jgi:hypothetical protein
MTDMIVDFDTPTLRVNYRPADPQFKVNVGGTEYAFGNNSPSLVKAKSFNVLSSGI